MTRDLELTTVANPYRDEDLAKQVAELQSDPKAQAVTRLTVAVSVVSSLFTAGLLTVLYLVCMVFTPLQLSGLASALLGSFIASAAMQTTRLRKQARKHRELVASREELWAQDSVLVPSGLAWPMKKLSDFIQELTAEHRGEVRDVWDASLDLCDRARVDETFSATEPLWRRANAVLAIVREEQALEAAEAEAASAMEREIEQARLRPLTNDDLTAAQHTAEALAEGVRTYKQIAQA